MVTDAMDLLALLDAAELVEAGNARTAARANAGQTLTPDSGTVAGVLLTTYRKRIEHLQGFDTHHAQRLLRSTMEFCDQLAQQDPDANIALLQIDDPLIGTYAIWMVAETLQVVGCLYLIGRSEVPAGEWEALWKHP